MEEITKRLKRLYAFLLAPAVLIIAVFGILEAAGVYKAWNSEALLPVAPRLLSVITLVTEISIAVVWPIWLRISKAGRVRTDGPLDTQAFLSFQSFLIGLSEASFYFALLAVFLHVDKVPLLITALIGIYALYTSFPSNERILSDYRIFGVSR